MTALVHSSGSSRNCFDMLYPLTAAYILYGQGKFDKCCTYCDKQLQKAPQDMAVWTLKMRAMTEKNYVDDIEVDNSAAGSLAEAAMDDVSVAKIARPGTSVRTETSKIGAASSGPKPGTSSGRAPVGTSGYARPSSKWGGGGVRSARTAVTARPVTSASGRFVRMGTAAAGALSGQIVDPAHLNVAKYGKMPTVNKAIFEYLLFELNNVRTALELAAVATEASEFKDWYWKLALARCYMRLGLYRDAERQLRSAINHSDVGPDVWRTLAKLLHLCMDQPKAAEQAVLSGLRAGLSSMQAGLRTGAAVVGVCGEDTHLVTMLARVYEDIGDSEKAVVAHKRVLAVDPTNIEALACVAAYHFYNDQPEISLQLFRRLMQIGLVSAELMNNLGLSCFYSCQYDLAMLCFDKALSLASNDPPVLADIWYNIGYIGLVTGDISLARHSLRLALASEPDHSAAYNNLAVLNMMQRPQVQPPPTPTPASDTSESTQGSGWTVLLEASQRAVGGGGVGSGGCFEAFYNMGLLCLNETGNLETGLAAAKRADTIKPRDARVKLLIERIQNVLMNV